MTDLHLQTSRLPLSDWCAARRVDGGRNIQGDIMKIERETLFEFQVTLTNINLDDLIAMSDNLSKSCEDALRYIIENALDKFCDAQTGKE